MKQHHDLLIVGQGIAGTLLHYELSKRGKSVLIIDRGHQHAASAVASGLINPITGRKYVKSWMFDDLYVELDDTYKKLGDLLGDQFLKEHGIVRTLSSIKEENLWYSKSALSSYEKHFVSDVDDSEYKHLINGAVSFGEVKGGAKVDLKALIKAYRTDLANNDLLLEEKFDHSLLRFNSEDQWEYKTHTCDKIVFCEGWRLRENPYFEKLGQEAAKGEVLIIKLAVKRITRSIKKKIFITPLKDDLYWVGSTYEWDFEDANPTNDKRQYLIDAMDEMYNEDYEIVDHWAGVRPTTLDRRPLLGVHPNHKTMYVFNGLGTKGASLAPYWAKQMATYLLDGGDLPTEVDISRYS